MIKRAPGLGIRPTNESLEAVAQAIGNAEKPRATESVQEVVGWTKRRILKLLLYAAIAAKVTALDRPAWHLAGKAVDMVHSGMSGAWRGREFIGSASEEFVKYGSDKDKKDLNDFAGKVIARYQPQGIDASEFQTLVQYAADEAFDALKDQPLDFECNPLNNDLAVSIKRAAFRSAFFGCVCKKLEESEKNHGGIATNEIAFPWALVQNTFSVSRVPPNFDDLTGPQRLVTKGALLTPQQIREDLKLLQVRSRLEVIMGRISSVKSLLEAQGIQFENDFENHAWTILVEKAIKNSRDDAEIARIEKLDLGSFQDFVVAQIMKRDPSKIREAQTKALRVQLLDSRG